MRVLSVVMLALSVTAQEEEAVMLQAQGHHGAELDPYWHMKEEPQWYKMESRKRYRKAPYKKESRKRYRKGSYKEEAPKRYRKGSYKKEAVTRHRNGPYQKEATTWYRDRSYKREVPKRYRKVSYTKAEPKQYRKRPYTEESKPYHKGPYTAPYAASTKAPSQTFTLDPGADCIVGAFTIDAAITGSHSVHMELCMPSYKDVATEHLRQWILNIGQEGENAHHWLWSPTGLKGEIGDETIGDIQFGPWSSGGQIKVFNATGEGEETKELLADASSLTTTYNAETGMYTLYMNKELVASSNVGTNFDFTDNTLLVAQLPNKFSQSSAEIAFKGCVFLVALWHSELAASDVARLYYPEVIKKFTPYAAQSQAPYAAPVCSTNKGAAQ